MKAPDSVQKSSNLQRFQTHYIARRKMEWKAKTYKRRLKLQLKVQCLKYQRQNIYQISWRGKPNDELYDQDETVE